MNNYFKNFNNEQLKTYANYLCYQVNGNLKGKNIKDYIMENSGDDYVKVLHDDKYNLIVLSVDSGITVINCIKKDSFSNSQAIEL